jgi:hypothetical protein
MRQVQHRLAVGRRIPYVRALLAAGLIATPLSLASAQTPAAPASQAPAAPAQQPAAQQPAAQPPAGQQPAAPPGITFDGDSGILIMYIKPDKTADFESAMAKLRDALTKSEKPERCQQAAGWKLYKAAEPGPNGSVTYVNVMSPVLKGADYTMTKILYETFPTESQQIFPLLRDSFAGGMGKLTLTTVQDYTKAGQ